MHPDNDHPSVIWRDCEACYSDSQGVPCVPLFPISILQNVSKVSNLTGGYLYTPRLSLSDPGRQR
jgi:hypothetical protein